MTRGPERLRLDAALAEADEAVVRANGEAEWLSATYRLRDVSRALRVAANSGLGIGGQTGPAMFKAMRRSADHLDERITLFNEGREALGSAAETIRRVREQRDRLDTDPETAALADPGEFRELLVVGLEDELDALAAVTQEVRAPHGTLGQDGAHAGFEPIVRSGNLLHKIRLLYVLV